MATCGICNLARDDVNEVKSTGICKRVFHAACINCSKSDGDGVATIDNLEVQGLSIVYQQ